MQDDNIYQNHLENSRRDNSLFLNKIIFNVASIGISVTSVLLVVYSLFKIHFNNIYVGRFFSLAFLFFALSFGTFIYSFFIAEKALECFIAKRISLGLKKSKQADLLNKATFYLIIAAFAAIIVAFYLAVR